MPVKINGATSGSVTLAAPATGTDVTLSLPTSALATETFATSAASTAAAPMGLVAVAPTSIANSGGSASLSGYTVSFSGVSSVSLNGVFTGDYDNYRVMANLNFSSGATLRVRVRASGSDLASSSYYWTITSGAGTNDTSIKVNVSSGVADRSNFSADISEPYVAAQTGWVSLSNDAAGFGLTSASGGVRNTNAYDGFTLFPSAGTITGKVSVYGYRK